MSRRLCSCQDFSVSLRIEHCFLGGGESVNVPSNVSRTRLASPAQQRASSEVSCYTLVACAARRSCSPLNCLQQVFTTMAGCRQDWKMRTRRVGKPTWTGILPFLDGQQVDAKEMEGSHWLGEKIGVTKCLCWPALHVAGRTAFEWLGQRCRPRTQHSRIGVACSRAELCGHATTSRLVTGRVVQAEARLANIRRPAATPTVC